MKLLPVRWLRAWLAAVGLALAAAGAAAELTAPAEARWLESAATAPPADTEPWTPTRLPDIWRVTRPGLLGATAWYRLVYELPADPRSGEGLALYLPYLNEGGRLFLNGEPLAHLGEPDAHTVVTWFRPHAVALPPAMLRPGRNVVHVRVALWNPRSAQRFPMVWLGSADEVREHQERRHFWTQGVPQITVVACLLMALLTGWIWWRRRDEVLIGLLGVAAACWAVRTLTFLLEQIPLDVYPWWRAVFHAATGGCVVAMTVFAWRFAGQPQPRLERLLIAYALIGPAWVLLGGLPADAQVGRWWSAGLFLLAPLMVGWIVYAAVYRRSMQAALLLAVMVLAFAAGLNDYLLTWGLPWLYRIAPDWADHRLFLLHNTASGLLLASGAILASRFVQSLSALERSNLDLEQRVAARERELADRFEELLRLRRDHEIEDERRRITQDIHDGLGSMLFAAQARHQAGELPLPEVGPVLRDCIAEMRLAIDALSPADEDFTAALGSFRYRWEAQLRSAGIASRWRLGLDGATDLAVPYADRLQVLRILQEALTNVLKHAQATRVEVSAEGDPQGTWLTVSDDGVGRAATRTPGGRGLDNMRQRAARIGGRLEIVDGEPGTEVRLFVPRPRASPGADAAIGAVPPSRDGRSGSVDAIAQRPPAA